MAQYGGGTATADLDVWLKRRPGQTQTYNQNVPDPATDPTPRPGEGQGGPDGGPPAPPPNSVWDMWESIQQAFAKAQGNTDTSDDWWAGREADVRRVYDTASKTWGPDIIKGVLNTNWGKAYLAAMEALRIPGYKPYYDRTGDGTRANKFWIPGWDYGYGHGNTGYGGPGQVDYGLPDYSYT